MTRRSTMPALLLALAALVLALLLLATVHLASADCVIGPGAICPPDSWYPPRAYVPVVVWH